MDKKTLTEQDIRTKFITPAIISAGWDTYTQIREEMTFTDGQIMPKRNGYVRGERRRADYVLSFKENMSIAVVEAKDNNHRVGDGMQQALAYAEALDIPFVFSSNGDGFLFHDRTGQSPQVEQEISLESFPSPAELWSKFLAWKGLAGEAERIYSHDFYPSGKEPRYYQRIAINRTIEAIATGQNRVLLVMATGTGKTFTAFQIIWRLWKSGAKKRILFLADRNILVDQTKNNDFKPFGPAMTKITKRTINKAFEIYLALYQAVSGTEEESNIYRQFSPDFFDLVVVDECHRGSAAEDSAWRVILEYFSSATQIGMTATPRETTTVSNIHYFGEPIYIYSLRQGIEDGFLAPYRVIRIDIDRDLQGWRPPEGKVDKYGEVIEDRIYNQRDFDKTLVLDKRTELVAQTITEYLQGTDPFAKTIVFCEDIDHAERMRQALVNGNPERMAESHKYVMRITGDDPVGKAELDNFIDPESRYPVVATTSKLLSTGVDAQTCKLIVLDQRIQSMTEFKQIIGRGTRINEEHGKYFFTIMDFKGATDLFADPDFDGLPEQIYQPNPGDPPIPPDFDDDGTDPTDDSPVLDEDGLPIDFIDEEGAIGDIDQVGSTRRKYYVDDVPVAVLAKRVQYIDPQTGTLITESLQTYARRSVQREYRSLDDFLQKWNASDRKDAIIQELEGRGVFFDALADDVGKDLDPFDIICHVAFDQPPLTRKERANNVRKSNYFTKYGDDARAVLDALLEKYADEGIESIEDLEILKIRPFSDLGTPIELVRLFGGKENYLQAIAQLSSHLYGFAS